MDKCICKRPVERMSCSGHPCQVPNCRQEAYCQIEFPNAKVMIEVCDLHMGDYIDYNEYTPEDFSRLSEMPEKERNQIFLEQRQRLLKKYTGSYVIDREYDAMTKRTTSGSTQQRNISTT